LHFVTSFCGKLYDGAIVFTFGFFRIEVISCSAQCACFLILLKHVVRKEGNLSDGDVVERGIKFVRQKPFG
jgi:hypothetical protein